MVHLISFTQNFNKEHLFVKKSAFKNDWTPLGGICHVWLFLALRVYRPLQASLS